MTNTGLKQVTDQCSAVGIGLIRFAPRAAKPFAEVVEHEIDISVEGVRYN